MPRIEEQSVLAAAYVAALLDLTANEQHAQTVADDLESLVRMAKTERDFKAFVESPIIGPEVKKRFLERVLAGRVNELTLRFLNVLADRQRLDLLAAAAVQYQAERDRRRNRVPVEAATAVPLTDPQRQMLRVRLGGQLGGEVLLAERVDPRLIGGLVLKIGDYLFDGSVRHRLEQLRRKIVSRGSHEIQGGRDFLAD